MEQPAMTTTTPRCVANRLKSSPCTALVPLWWKERALSDLTVWFLEYERIRVFVDATERFLYARSGTTGLSSALHSLLARRCPEYRLLFFTLKYLPAQMLFLFKITVCLSCDFLSLAPMSA
jgi:hypothetical protein